MSQTERFYKIDQLLNDRGVVSFKVLMEALAISRATLKRDLAYLRDRLNAPIVYDRVKNGYRLFCGIGSQVLRNVGNQIIQATAPPFYQTTSASHMSDRLVILLNTISSLALWFIGRAKTFFSICGMTFPSGM